MPQPCCQVCGMQTSKVRVSRTSVVTRASNKGFGKEAPVKQPQPQKQRRMGNTMSKAETEAAQEAFAARQRVQEGASAPEPSGRADDDDDVAPTEITDRMLKRVLLFAGVPVFFGMALYPFFWYLKVIKHIDLPMGTVFVVQSLVFGAGLLGITYGAISASWDPSRTGSFWGWQEFRANFAAIMGKIGDK